MTGSCTCTYARSIAGGGLGGLDNPPYLTCSYIASASCGGHATKLVEIF